MKITKTVFLLILTFNSIAVIAQSEEDIKVTGSYTFSWSLDRHEAAAKEKARLGLLDTIYINILKKSSINKDDTIFTSGIHFFIKKVGLKWQAIAFIDKQEMEKCMDRFYKSQSPIESNINSVKIIKTGNPVLDDLLTAHDSKSLENKLKLYRSGLKANFGSKENYPDDSECYLFVIDEINYAVIAVLDKGNLPRKNLLSGMTENNITEKYNGKHIVYVVIN